MSVQLYTQEQIVHHLENTSPTKFMFSFNKAQRFPKVDKKGKTVDYEIFESVIKSRIQMTYKKANKVLKGEETAEYYTLVPIKAYFKGNKLKVLIGIARGKKTYDKRETIKNRDVEREVRKNIKNYK